MATDWPKKLQDTFQPHVAEPVQAVGLLQPAGTWGVAGLSQLSGLAAVFKSKSVNENAGGLARSGVFRGTKLCGLVLTADKVYAFAVKPKGMGWKVQDQLGAWERKDLKFTVTEKKMTSQIDFHVASTGDHYELEATTLGSRGIHEPFLAELQKG
jgi:hypothetical protein